MKLSVYAYGLEGDNRIVEDEEMELTEMESYEQMKLRHQEEYNAFAAEHVHYAFGREQKMELLEKLGISEEQLEADYTGMIGGGCILKTKLPDLTRLFQRQEMEMIAWRSCADVEALSKMFYGVMADHEYLYEMDDVAIIMRCGLSVKDFNSDGRYGEAFVRAREQYFLNFDNDTEDE